MLSVIIDARRARERLPILLAQLTAGAVEGLVRQVLIVAPPETPDIAAICDETGADFHGSVEAAARAARSERVLLLAADFRFRDGWIAALETHLARGGGSAVVAGDAEGRVFPRRLTGLLVEQGRLQDGVDPRRLRRDLGWRPDRIG